MNSMTQTAVASQAMSGPQRTAAFLSRLSLEITPRQTDKIAAIAQRVAPGTRVFVALVDPGQADDQVGAVAAVRAAGLEPVPHVPARFVTDEDELRRRVAALAEAGAVTDMLVLGGGAPEPIGRYDAALQLLETGVFQANGIHRIGIAGHPEGNPDIAKARGEAMLMQALKDKQAWIEAHGLDGYIATQFLFEAGPVAYWADTLRRNGITLPVHVGIPGPASIKTLVKYAALCGVGNSARFIRRQALSVTRLLSVSAPDGFVDDLAELHFARPNLGIGAPHFYPFGGFDKLFDWVDSRAA